MALFVYLPVWLSVSLSPSHLTISCLLVAHHGLRVWQTESKTGALESKTEALMGLTLNVHCQPLFARPIV